MGVHPSAPKGLVLQVPEIDQLQASRSVCCIRCLPSSHASLLRKSLETKAWALTNTTVLLFPGMLFARQHAEALISGLYQQLGYLVLCCIGHEFLQALARRPGDASKHDCTLRRQCIGRSYLKPVDHGQTNKHFWEVVRAWDTVQK